ncbi:laminin subunit alpha-3-like isoform X2 [Anguilla anguilla]|uniref:laminin subunit alpha-3-like isoform X2 n=1 Tax=Anguilla anguilla TaxID=7936 RepID=UPI0015A94499|nr:laminin subunit alpha-3-like isoform X2 [Anguilla anguilla]
MSNMARGKKEAFALLLLLALVLLGAVNAQLPANEITGFSLSPPYFNLAEGARISATATCGEDDTGIPRSDLYCKLVGGPTTELPSQTIQGQFCEYCNSNDPNAARPASNAIDGTERWWQSPPLSRSLRYNEVNVTLDLGQLFHVAYVLIKFANSPRPDLWVLERSVDNGRTYVPWQYFAHLKRDCLEFFGKQPNARISRDDDQICTTEYSRIVPLENGEIVVSLVNGRPGARNFTYSPVLRDFTKATNIRLRFLRTSTLLGHLISKAQRDPTVTRRYYYSIKDISVGGRCVCHGHALVCGARDPNNSSSLQCECLHNTCGESCGRCCPGFNQKPWRAATADSANECHPCMCHSHATDCYYDPEVDRIGASLNVYGQYDGGGVCISCQHNTAGVNCERCAEGFYRPHGAQPDSPYACAPCSCDPRTTAGCEDGSGRCICRLNFSGDNCDRCADGYHGFPQCIRHQTTTKSPAGHIVDPDSCSEGSFGPPSCQPCRCDGPGVATQTCDGQTGECFCRPGFQSRFCDRCEPGRFSYPYCQECPCDREGTLPEGCDAYGQCLCRSEVEGPQCDRCRPGYHSFPDCQDCHCSEVGSYERSCDLESGQCRCRPGVTGQRCDRCVDVRRRFPQCDAPIECRCDREGTLPERCDAYGRCLCRSEVEGPQCDRCRPGYHSFPDCQACQCSRDGSYEESCDLESGQCRCRPGVTGQRCDRCVDVRRRFPQCDAPIECPCNREGTLPERCDAYGRCLCRSEVEGPQCDRCRPGYHSFPDCQACQCSELGSYEESCDLESGQCRCRPGVTGQRCDRCVDVRRRFPQCDAPIECVCNREGTLPERCDAYGRCLCRAEVEGPQCDRCRPGYHSFPDCQACRCDGVGVADGACGPRGDCRCHTNYAGRRCEQCARGYYGYPNCGACQCSRDGSYEESCDLASGQCRCRPGVTGQRCDRCVDVRRRFPQCDAPIEPPVSRCNPVGTDVNRVVPNEGQCPCLADVEGLLCDRCKPLFWNLASENQNGCIACQCDVKGTLSGVGECEQESGKCFCKPNTCGHTCNTCKEGYFLHQKKNYFGCQGCQCDVGGALGRACAEPTGQCLCRKHVVGRTCNQPETNYYFPDLYHMKFEVEDGITPNGRPARFGYNPQEFPDFSWRGYATMSRGQSEVRITVHVEEGRSSVFRFILRFINPGGSSVTGRVTAAHVRGTEGQRHSKEVVFPPSRTPAFVTIPGSGFAEPFPLAPGKWIIHIRAEDVLLDYLVLLPSVYYEAPILQSKTTEPCTYVINSDNMGKNCLLYRHTPMDRFPSALASQGVFSSRGRRKRQARVRRPTPEHPEMASVSGRQAQLQLTLRVPSPGRYVLVLEYASEVDALQNVNVLLSSQPQAQAQAQARVNIDSCAYSFLCRGVAVDGSGRVALLQMDHKTDVLLQTSTASFLLYKVYAVPADKFSMEYVDPKELCVSVHGRFSEDSRLCVPPQYEIPPSALVLDAAREGRLSVPSGGRQSRQAGPAPLIAPPRDGVLLKSPQTEISFSARVPVPGRYVFVVHFRQPELPFFPVEVLVDGGRPWKGSINASFCPRVSGCRDQVIAEQRIALDVPRQDLTVTLRVPPGKTLILDYILVFPDESYGPELLREKPLGRSSDFINQCGGNSFYIDPSSSQFCRDSARSLVAFFNNGALPCGCDEAGATGPTCDPEGGQCTCRPNIIGRQCTRCATGHYGFPYCRPCKCGRRLCDEVTGQCICPPQTIRPACDVCESQTFSYHPLLGCEGCDCSPNGIDNVAEEGCNQTTGQCACKDHIDGRQCDRCTAGYYGFPECAPCDCNMGGVVPDVCHPQTGKCLCKKNVVGVRCDSCRKGSFHFDESNPSGCLSCFCFGATDQCRSSGKRRGKFVDMKSWRLEKLDQEEVPSVFNTASNTVVADVQELPATVKDLHWVAPKTYLGDRVSSYGGFLTYQLKSFGIPSEGMVLLDRSADLLLSRKEVTLVHRAPLTPSADRLYEGRVQLIEGNFRREGTDRPVSREVLMAVLADLDALHIRGLYFSQSQRLSLGEVGLEEATPTGSGVSSSMVEVCTCPPGHQGDSCQKCAPGYYRDRSQQGPGRCVPCSCNGLSNACDEATGRCLNCKQNTAGYRCEQCKEGYYGNPTNGTCRVCPCPFNVESNSFATSCKKVPGGFVCVCRQGYTGPRCERCAPGYYGDPMDLRGSCQPCNCNGNGNCDSKTGVCKNTLEPKDTTDEQCQECDSCVETLLKDLESLDDMLSKLKSQLENVNASSAVQERLKKLEDAIAAAKTLVKIYSTSITSQVPKVKQLEDDAKNLSEDIGLIKKKATENSEKAQEAVDAAEKTHDRAEDLAAGAESIFNKIKDLLKELNDATSGAGSLPTEDLAKILSEAERMVRDMKARDFSDLKNAAEKENEEAKKLLDHIKNDVTKQYELNKDAVKRIAGLLKDHEAKLKDLEEALKEADSTVKKANQQNGVNAKILEDLLKKKKELEKERDQVLDQIKMAKDQLKGTKDLLDMLADSKKEYEQLAAQLDGAKTDLTKKVNDITQAAAKEDIVEKAEKHAETLNRLAKDLQEAVRNASGSSDVRCAVDAIEAYKNITEAIKAAEDAANEAKKAADKALSDVQNQDLTKRAQDLKDNGDELLKTAKDAQNDLKNAADELDTQKKRLAEAEKKKDALKSDLLAAQAELDKIKRDDVADMIDAAKRTAANANDTAKDAMDRLNAIKDEVDKINVLPTDPNLDNVLNDVDKSVKNLTNTIPSLLDKISQIEDLSTQITPTGNVSENIKRIKELIELARDAANRITVPMKFAGDGHVELRTPKDMDDLMAYTALSLSLQRPENGRGDGGRRRRQTSTDDLFVLYLGKKDASTDYIGMVLKNNELFCIYKLNGKEYKIQTKSINRSPTEPSYFDKVDFRRIYEDAEVILTQLFTSSDPYAPVTYHNRGEITRNLLNLDPEDVVFYVGGYPDTFTPPASLNYPKYKGCIEMSTFNEKFISLYNFKKAVNVNTELPCKRYIPSEVDLYFEGTGYAKIAIDKSSNVLVLSQSVYTRSENALLLYIGNEDSFYTFAVEGGYVVFRGREGDKVLEKAKSTEKLFPLEKQEEIQVILRKTSFLVRLGSKTALTASYTQGQYDSYYLGGLPPMLRERDSITTPPMKGCVRNIKMGGSHANLLERVGMSKGCPKDYLASRKAEFSLGSSLSAPPGKFELSSDVTVSLGFKSTESNGLLLTNSQAGNGIELAMDNGFVLFKFNDKVWKSNKTYKDGKWHYLTAARIGQRFEFLIDEQDEGQQQSSSSSIAAEGNNVFLGKDTFKGCLANLYMRRPDVLYKPEDLSEFSTSGEILLDVCSSDRPPLLMVDKRNRSFSRMEEEVRDDSLSVCSLPSMVKHSYRLGGPFSSLTYNITPQALRSRPHFSLDVRTESADGLLLYVAGSQDSSHLVLYMSKGRIRLSIGRKQHIFNREKYSDGKWHTVMFSWERRKFRLVVDGLRAHNGQLSPDEGVSLDLQSPVYLGSVPASVRMEQQWKDLPRESIIGCVRNFKMNSQPMAEPTANYGAAPCFDGHTVGGAYFSGNGYAVIEDNFVVGVSFELVFEVRPRTLTGVIFHVGGKGGHHLSLFLRRGEVVVQVNNGAGEFNVSVTPQKMLCNSMFHRVAVIKRNNVIQLDVDTEGRYTVGPSSSVSTRTRDPLYVGGIPDSTWSTQLPKTSFVGCLQNVQINGNTVSFDKIARVFGPVNLRECPSS